MARLAYREPVDEVERSIVSKLIILKNVGSALFIAGGLMILMPSGRNIGAIAILGVGFMIVGSAALLLNNHLYRRFLVGAG